MEAWQSAMQLLQLHLQELDAAAGKQPAASSPPITATMLRANVYRLVGAELSRTVVGQMLQAEVPLRVANVCCKVLQHSGAASSSTAAASAHPHASEQELGASTWCAYCLTLPYLLLTACLKPESMRAGQATPVAPVALLGQQFQQSGFLDLLPQLLRETADQLQAAAAGAAAAANTAPLPKLTQQDWESRPDLLLLKGAFYLLGSYVALAKCWPRGKFVFELVPACAPAVVQLASISFQRASQLLGHHQMDTFSHMVVYNLWVEADDASRLAFTPNVDLSYATESSLSFLDSSGMQQYHSVLFKSPHTGQCLAVVLTSAVYTALLLQLPRLTDMSASSSRGGGDGSGGGGGSRSSASSSSSSSSSISSARGGRDGKPARKLRALQCTDPNKAWQFACEQHQLLPPTHHELLRQVACSSRAVLCTAARMAAKWATLSCSAADRTIAVRGLYRLNTVMDMYRVYSARCEQISDQQRQQQQHTSQEQQQQHLLLLCLVPGVLLYRAALQPPSVAPGVSINVEPAMYSSRRAVSAAMRLLGHSSTAGIPTSANQALSSHRTLCPFIPASVCETVLTDVLTLATRIGARYLASLGAEHSTTGTDSTGGSGSSSGTGANSSSSSIRAASSSSCSTGAAQSDGGTTAMPVAEQVAPTPVDEHDMAVQLVCLLAMFSEDTDFSAAGAASGAGAAQVQPPSSAAVWQQHTLAVAHLLEGTVRHSTLRRSKMIGYVLLGLIGDSGPGPIAAGSRAAGPGSPEQQQLISLLCSTLKALATSGGQQACIQARACLVILGAASAALCEASGQHSVSEASTAAAAAAERNPALAAVPWLAIMGRCLLLLAALLPAVQTPMLFEGVPEVIQTLQVLLSDDGPASLTAQLTAAGYISWEAIPAQLQPVADAAQALGMPDGSPPSHDQVSTAAELMTALGLSLSSLAFPTACNNPRCSNLSGPSELLLVSGRSNMCAGCLVARYCSRDCQRQHWKQHKPVCKALAAAAAKTANADSAAAAAAAAAAK